VNCTENIVKKDALTARAWQTMLQHYVPIYMYVHTDLVHVLDMINTPAVSSLYTLHFNYINLDW
jgi:hypothetical protein